MWLPGPLLDESYQMKVKQVVQELETRFDNIFRKNSKPLEHCKSEASKSLEPSRSLKRSQSSERSKSPERPNSSSNANSERSETRSWKPQQLAWMENHQDCKSTTDSGNWEAHSSSGESMKQRNPPIRIHSSNETIQSATSDFLATPLASSTHILDESFASVGSNHILTNGDEGSETMVVHRLVTQQFKGTLEDLYRKSFRKTTIGKVEDCSDSWERTNSNLSKLLDDVQQNCTYQVSHGAISSFGEDCSDVFCQSKLGCDDEEDVSTSNGHKLISNDDKSASNNDKSTFNDDKLTSHDDKSTFNDDKSTFNDDKLTSKDGKSTSNDNRLTTNVDFASNEDFCSSNEAVPTSHQDFRTATEVIFTSKSHPSTDHEDLVPPHQSTSITNLHGINGYNETRFSSALERELFKSQSTNTDLRCVHKQITASSSSVGDSDISALVSEADGTFTIKSRSKTLEPNNMTLRFNNMSLQSFTEESDTSSYASSITLSPSLENSLLPGDTLKMEELSKNCRMQEQIVSQASKAIDICKRSKEFNSSTEQVEAERVLLIASTKLRLLKEEMNKIYEEVPQYTNLGKITVSEISFPIKDGCLSPELRKRTSEWFVCLLSNGTNVLASEPVLWDASNSVVFQNSFEFSHLPTHFEIVLDLYVLSIRNNLRSYSHESKYHLNKSSPAKTCPSPKNLFSMTRDVSRKSLKLQDDHRTNRTSFEKWAELTLRIGDLQQANSARSFMVTSGSTNLMGTATLKMFGDVQIDETLSGFLNVSSEVGGCIIWHRRWCSLKGSAIRYWNYPRNEEFEAPPVGILDLRYCVTSWISRADRELCPRPRTLMLELVRTPHTENRPKRSSYLVERYFLQTESAVELNQWQTQVNSVISCLRNWNCMECHIQFPRNGV